MAEAERRRRTRVLLVVAGVSAVVSVVTAVSIWWRGRVTVTPEPPAPKPPVLVEVSKTTVAVAGKPLLTLPVTQAHTGVEPVDEVLHDTPRVAAAQLAAAIQAASRDGKHDSNRVDILFVPNASARVANDVWGAAQGFTRRLSVPASVYGPATTVYSPAHRSHGNEVLSVYVRQHGVVVGLRQGKEHESVGAGCAVGREGLAAILRRPTDYEALGSCFEALRRRLPPGEPANPWVTVQGGVPVAKMLYVVNLLRCGRVSCREDEPRLWDTISVSSTFAVFPAFWTVVEPALQACYDSLRARGQLDETVYETDLQLRREQGRLRYTIGVGLPRPLETCARRALADAEPTIAKAQTTVTLMPLVFGPREP